MNEERMMRGAYFAQLQGELFRLGVPVGTDLTPVQKICAEMCRVVGDEAVAAATIFVTEREIAQAIEDFAARETAAGRLANWARLREAARTVREAAQVAGDAEIKALVKLRHSPDQLPGPLGAGLRERAYAVGRMIAPTVKTSLAPLNRLVAEVAQDAYELGQADGRAEALMDPDVEDETGAWLEPSKVSPPDQLPSMTEMHKLVEDMAAISPLYAEMTPEDAARAKDCTGWVLTEKPSVVLPAMDTSSVTYAAFQCIAGTLAWNGRGLQTMPLRRHLEQAPVLVGTGETEAAARADLWRKVCWLAAQWIRGVAEASEDHELYEDAAIIAALTQE